MALQTGDGTSSTAIDRARIRKQSRNTVQEAENSGGDWEELMEEGTES